jgi:ABC-type bacteriocin/lantibiotic exporter with double-glycine peptidase domain
MFAPEVIQTSAMDCGPASLASLLRGFGIEASYARLREACQTSVDGTSIDTMEEVAVRLGLDAEQIMLPADHLPLATSECLPAIIITRLPDGATHFVVLWSNSYGVLQLMDPGTGRRWTTWRAFADEVFIHRYTLPAADFLDWVSSEGFLEPLRERLRELHLGDEQIAPLIERAGADPGWRGLAALDAATRMTAALVRAGGLHPGAEAARAIEHLAATATDPEAAAAIPGRFWFARPLPPEERDPEAEEEQIAITGAVLVRARGLLPERSDQADADSELAAVIGKPPPRPEGELLRQIRADGWLAPGALLIAVLIAALSVTVQTVLLQSIFRVTEMLGLFEQRVAAIGLLLGFTVVLCALELAVTASTQRVGRRLDMRLRVALLEKIARVGDRYFHSRLVSDMVHRAHDMRHIRNTPEVVLEIVRLGTQIILTTAGLVWINPQLAPLAVLVSLVFILLTVATSPIMAEYDMRLRTHSGSLNRFYLDTLLGLVPLRMHGAARTMRRQHEMLLSEWMRSSLALVNVRVISGALESICYFSFAVGVVVMALSRAETGSVLLLLYWSLNLPTLARQLTDEVLQYPQTRNRMRRVLEILSAPDEVPPVEQAEAERADPDEVRAGGVAISLDGVRVEAGGQTVLREVSLSIGAGEHVAVVGPSGAGKSSLAGLLLGWHVPAEGAYVLDGAPADGARLLALRRETAWVDPATQLWNRSLLDNLEYGRLSPEATLSKVIEEANLFGVLDRMPEGLQTALGEDGGLVSGGEGQRVRLGRAMNRPEARLVILDEPFRGLDRAKRRELLARVRAYWRDATLICITHDIAETQAFERVLVIEGGGVVEDDSPEALAAEPDSRYSALLAAEEDVTHRMWESEQWRRLWLADGQVAERAGEERPTF